MGASTTAASTSADFSHKSSWSTSTTAGGDGNILLTNNKDLEFQPKRGEVESALAKAVELRTLHAAATKPNSHRYPPPLSPVSASVSQGRQEDYPIFTPVSLPHSGALFFLSIHPICPSTHGKGLQISLGLVRYLSPYILLLHFSTSHVTILIYILISFPFSFNFQTSPFFHVTVFTLLLHLFRSKLGFLSFQHTLSLGYAFRQKFMNAFHNTVHLNTIT